MIIHISIKPRGKEWFLFGIWYIVISVFLLYGILNPFYDKYNILKVFGICTSILFFIIGCVHLLIYLNFKIKKECDK